MHLRVIEVGRFLFGTFKSVPPDFGASIAERHARGVLIDYLLGDFYPTETVQ